MVDEAESSPGNGYDLGRLMDIVKRPVQTPLLVAIGLASLLCALLVAGPILAAVVNWWRAGVGNHSVVLVLFSVLFLIGLLATAVSALSTVWQRTHRGHLDI